jgi:hypothetical protein
VIRVFVQGFAILSVLVSVSIYPFRVSAADKIRLGYSGVGSGARFSAMLTRKVYGSILDLALAPLR